MPFTFPVTMQDGTTYHVTKLLAKGISNAKTAKSEKAKLGYLTTSLSLAPAWESGFNLCASSSKGCRTGCLFTSGHAAISPRKILPARIAKSRMLRIYKDEFINQLRIELDSHIRKAKKNGLIPTTRLNTISDVMWEREFPALFTDYPDILYYDYTKHRARMMRYLKGELPANLHLTFSRSETNERDCLEILRAGGNVTVVFNVKYFRDKLQPLPKTWNGYTVIDGDLTDARFLDPKARKGSCGYVVGLRAKGRAKHDTSGFVVDPSF